MSKNIVFEGWLTKSPPSKRIWRTKWRRRWFALRQSGELPGQYFLDYFADRNCRRLKGTINLDLCEQVDAGLHMERGNGVLAPKDRGSVFTIQTQTRIYHLEADCEADMEKWVDAICRVCGLRATDNSSNNIGPIQNNMEHQSNIPGGPEVYIPISECVTGARVQKKKTFTFDLCHIDMSSGTAIEFVGDTRSNQMYQSHRPQIRIKITESENESNISDEDCPCPSYNVNENDGRSFSGASKTFRRLKVEAAKRNVIPEADDKAYTFTAMAPPRPPKTSQARELQHKQNFATRLYIESEVGNTIRAATWNRRAAPPSPLKHLMEDRDSDEEEEESLKQPSPGHQEKVRAQVQDALAKAQSKIHTQAIVHNSKSQYCNIGLPMAQPPAVDRNLKPYRAQIVQCSNKSDTIQYLDLDLNPSTLPPTRPQDVQARSKSDAEGAYRCVDILKTEAFNSTREDAEASRHLQE